MARLNKTPLTLRLKRGTKQQITATSPAPYQVEGEMAYATDTKGFYISDGTQFNEAAPSFEYRHEFIDGTPAIDYIGKAAGDSLESDSVWTIKKLTIASDGSSTVATATDVDWTNRATHTYS